MTGNRGAPVIEQASMAAADTATAAADPPAMVWNLFMTFSDLGNTDSVVGKAIW
jgi:hypothetical protein